MSKIKKIWCMLLVCAMIITQCPLFSTVFAQTVDNEPLKIEVTTDKSSYTAYGIAEITVKVTNTSNEAVNNISAEAVFEQLAPVGKNNETFKEIENLQSGENFTFSYKATLNANKVNINFFEKIILWFVRLFNGGYNATSHNIEADTENITEIKFGNYTAENVVKVGYEKTEIEMTDEEFEKAVDMITNVSTTFEEILKSEEYNNLSTEAKKNTIESKLNELINQGIIKTFNYNESSCTFSFEYINGLLGGVTVEEKHDKDCYSHTSSKLDYQNNTNLRNITTNGIPYTQAVQNDDWLFIFGADSEETEASANSYNYCNQLRNQYKDLDVNITLWDEVTVSHYKFLDDYSLIYIMSHGSSNAGVICTEEIYTEEKAKKDYKEDIKNKDIYIHSDNSGSYFWIRPSFFKNNYKNNKLQDSIILLSCCCAFGTYGKESYLLADSFINAGADTVLGFCDSVDMNYSNAFYNKVLNYLVRGNTINEAYEYSKVIVGENENRFFDNCYVDRIENPPAYPLIRGNSETKLFNESLNGLNSYTTTVIDSVTGEAIENVTVLVSNSETMNALMHLERTNSAGKITIHLPKGKYYCLLDKDGYVSQTIEINLQENSTTIATPIYLEPIDTASVNGTVLDIDTKEGINNLKVNLILEEDQTKYITYTDNNGLFAFNNLPAGRYTLSFEHEDYTINGTHSFTLDEGLMFVFTDPFEFTKKDSTGGDDSGDTTDPNRTVTASGDCGANGDNVTWTLYDDGELVISGSGSMANYSSLYNSFAPWLKCGSIITSVIINDGITEIGEYAFYRCSLSSVIIPSTVKIIHEDAFRECTNLTKIILPNGVENIENSTFSECTSLAEVTIPESVISIGADSFFYCTSLKNITVSKNNQYYSSDDSGVLFNKEKTILIQYPIGNLKDSYKTPDGVTTIGESSFYKCTNLKKVTISDSVNTIYYSAFSDCTNLISVSLGNNIVEIESYAFNRCTNLKEITIPDKVQSISNGSFWGCTSLERITVDENNQYYSSDEYGVLFNKNKTNLIQYPIGNDREFYKIPNSVTYICNYAFADCTYLTSITISNTVEGIGYCAFINCSSLTSIVIPDSVKNINPSAFANCSSIESAVISNSMTTISESMFSGCTNLANVTIGDNITRIDNYAFKNCNHLTSVSIPNSVTNIGSSAFENCTSLTNLTIGNSLTNINFSAFANCTNIEDVYYTGDSVQWETITIGKYNESLTNATIHYNS